jgi:hypothetical protein
MKHSILIVIASLAAIADEPAEPGWNIEADGMLAIATLDDQHTELHYFVRIDWAGDQGPTYGQLTAELQATSSAVTTYNVIVDVQHHGALVASLGVPIQTSANASPILDEPIWSSCGANECSEQVEVIVRRPAVPGLTVEIAGTFHVLTEGYGVETPPGTQTIIVTGPT